MSAVLAQEQQAPAIAVLGTGTVGSALLAMLGATGATPARLVAVSNSRRMRRDARGLDPSAWSAALDAGEPADLRRLAATLVATDARCRVIVDVTASELVAAHHGAWLAQGIAVVTANKLAAAAPGDGWRALERAGGRYRRSATVGAGLPVISTLERLRAAGDRVRSIRGVLSGSLAHLFLRVEQGEAFSVALREAHALGLTEPDPREDLSGLDVARKLTIAARAAGIAIGDDALAVDDLVPLALRRGDAHAFLERCAALDAAISARRRRAAARGAVLRHVGRVGADGRGRVALVEVAADDPLAALRPGDNVVEITSDRYRANPLVIRGAGAGPTVTAGAVLADLAALGEARS